MKNLTPEEKTMVCELKNNHHLTIKEADKGGVVVIMNTMNYVADTCPQLTDSTNFCPTDTDLTPEHFDKFTHTKLYTEMGKHFCIDTIFVLDFIYSFSLLPLPSVHHNRTY